MTEFKPSGDETSTGECAMTTISQSTMVRMPFLVSVDSKLYVHFSTVTQEQAMSAYKGIFSGIWGGAPASVFDQIVDEIRVTDGVGSVEIHGQLVWGASLETISLSEYGLTKESLDSV